MGKPSMLDPGVAVKAVIRPLAPCIVSLSGMVLVLSLALPYVPPVLAAAPFYEGKVLTIIQGRSAGGLGDLRVRAAAPYLQKYLAGHPQIVFQYMAGAGGVQAANHMAGVAKSDGLTIANIATSIFINAISKDPVVRYSLSEFMFLGAPSVGGPYALVIRPLGLETVEKLKGHSKLRIAERSVGHTMYSVGRLMAFLLELKDPQWVVGYTSPEVEIAVERGEADARTEVLYDFMKNKGQLLQQGFTIPVVLQNIKGRGAEAVAGAPKIPSVNDYADTPLKKEVLRFYYNSRPGSSVYFAPRGIPKEAAESLRTAFGRLWEDRQFAREYERNTAEPTEPISGEEIEKFLQQIPKDDKVDKLVQQVLGAGPIPAAR
jgi:tripartite-type tricarboxylate transporter receptor subunit TctC